MRKFALLKPKSVKSVEYPFVGLEKGLRVKDVLGFLESFFAYNWLKGIRDNAPTVSWHYDIGPFKNLGPLSENVTSAILRMLQNTIDANLVPTSTIKVEHSLAI